MTRLNSAAALAFAVLLASCGGANKDEKGAAKAGETPAATASAEVPASQKAVPVSVQTVALETFTSYVEVQGKADFDQNATVPARAAGTITDLKVVRGDKVSKGQVLATLDASILDAAIAELRTRLDLTRIVWEKQDRLWKQQIGTEIQWLQAKNNKEALERSLATQQQQRDLYTVRAPFAGIIDEVYPKMGEATAPGAPIARLVSGQGAKIVAEVSEAYASRLKAGDKALVRIPDVSAEEFPATVRVASRSINTASRTFTVELRLQDGKRALELRPNMMVVVKVQDYQKQGAVTVPVDIVQHDEKDAFVFVADGGKATKRVVKTGTSYGGQTEILSGLKAGDAVITAGYQNLSEGQAVEAANTPS